VENVSPIIAPDREPMLQHLQLLFGRALAGKIEISGIHLDGGMRTNFFGVDQFEDAAEWALQLNAQPGWNVYVGAALRNDDVFPGKAAADTDFYRTYAVWADADTDEQVASAREAYRALSIEPPYIVVTGRTPSKRAQMWWPLETPISDIEALRGVLRGIVATLKTDPAVCTGKQLMRLAGGVNWPKKEDRILERTEVVQIARAAKEFSIEQLERAFPPLVRAERAAAGALPEVEIAMGGSLGLTETVMDGREQYAFKLVRAHLREWLGTTGSEPTVDELYREVAPIYLAKADQVRPGRGPTFLHQKCAEAVRAFQSGQIPGMRDLEEAVMTWTERHVVAEAEAKMEREEAAEIDRSDLFEVLSIADLKALPDAEWMVEERIPHAGLGFVYGAPGSYKSFICLDLALALAHGHGTWLDKPVKAPGSVLYLASEGATGMKNRIHAWQAKHSVTHDDGAFRLVRSSLSFMHPADVDRLERTVAAVVAASGPVSTVFVDTVSRVLPGADENLQKDMTLFVAACDRLRERFGATVIGVHHTNKNGDMRGSTVFLGQGDFVLRVDRNEGEKSGILTCEKQKEAEDGWKVAFAMEPCAWMVPGRLKEVSSLTVAFGGEPKEGDDGGWPPNSVCAAILKEIEGAWGRGKPWSPYPQTSKEGRYAVRNISTDFKVKAGVARMMIEAWQKNEILSLEVADAHSKAKGLRVISWPETLRRSAELP
jgi:nucleotide-binding universal stress UspA family protein